MRESSTAKAPINTDYDHAKAFLDDRSATAVRLSRMRIGDTGRVCGGRLDDADRDMLRALGLRPDARVRLSRVGEPCIVQVLGKHGCSCRIGLARPLAERVIVTIDDDQSGH